MWHIPFRFSNGYAENWQKIGRKKIKNSDIRRVFKSYEAQVLRTVVHLLSEWKHTYHIWIGTGKKEKLNVENWNGRPLTWLGRLRNGDARTRAYAEAHNVYHLIILCRMSENFLVDSIPFRRKIAIFDVPMRDNFSAVAFFIPLSNALHIVVVRHQELLIQ